MVRQLFLLVGGLGGVVLEVDGAEHPECGVPASTVVDHLNPACDSRTCTVTSRPALPVRVSDFLCAGFGLQVVRESVGVCHG